MKDKERGTPRYVGLHVIWWGGEDWQFTNCVHCKEPLRSALSIKNGYGPSCAKFSGIESLVKKTLKEERRRALEAIREKTPLEPHNRRLRRRATSHGRPPSTKQLVFLRALCEKTGRTFKTPLTSHQASIEINLLKSHLPQPRK